MNCNTAIAAFSNLSTAYNLVVINIAHVLIQNQYWCAAAFLLNTVFDFSHNDYCLGICVLLSGGDNCRQEVSIAATACLAGAIFGQLSFGYVGDCMGRSSALQVTMALSILGAGGSAFAVPLTSEPSSIFYFLALTRFVLGIGVGGVYPLSATIAAESSAATDRGRTASIVFSMQGVANLIVPLLALLLVDHFGNPPASSFGHDPGWAWRLTLAAGAVPGLLLAPFRVVETLHRLSLRRSTGRTSARTSARSTENSALGDAPEDPLQRRGRHALHGEQREQRRQLIAVASDGVSGDLDEPMMRLVEAAAPSISAAASASALRSTPPPPRVTLLGALRTPGYRGKLIGTAGGWFFFGARARDASPGVQPSSL